MKWIERCLQSIGQSTVPMTTLVIDNQSNDGTKQYIQTHFPDVILLPQDKNLGFGQANNRGIEYALSHDATHVLLLNQDAYVAPDMIEKLLEHDDGKHLLTPVHMNGDGSQIDGNFFRNTLHFVIPEKHSVKEVAYVNAACWLLPAAIVRQVGGFNPLFYHYGEDNNYIQRLQYYHFGLRLVSDTLVYHDRKTHGNEQMYQRGVLYRKLLMIQTDINLSGTQRWFKRLKTSIMEVGHSIKVHSFRACIKDYFAAICQLMAHYKAIRKSRQTEANTIGAWLNQ